MKNNDRATTYWHTHYHISCDMGRNSKLDNQQQHKSESEENNGQHYGHL